MDLKVLDYAIYLSLSAVLTVWVASTLSRHGKRFLVDVFHGDESLADSVNHLLVVGFYLVNLGYMSLQLKVDSTPPDAGAVFEALALKVGLVLVVLGAMHFTNVLILARMRRNAIRDARPVPPPILPPPVVPPVNPAYAPPPFPDGPSINPRTRA